MALDGFSGYAPAVYRVVAKAVKVMDPFHVVHLAAEKLTRCWQRVQHECTGRRGKTNGPLY
ncbi:Transposase [Corynebacterium testudinoris]|uniref:Transposase n=1 Tax=Corynebacterium testudinoris TaxID=136857 RepID=A0A0G3HBV3_9CORY|nr:Transposase [Corynebacterium testudinoris]